MSGKFKETCRHFAQGRCEWGAGCKFTHRTEPLDKPTGADWYHKKRPAPEREHERTSFDDTLTMQGVPCGGGWLRFWDEATGCHYYQNPDTGESRWETVPVKKPRQGEGSRAAPEVITIGNVPKQDRALCKFYEQGRCTRGAACQFYHAAPTVPDVQTAVQTALQAAASPMQQAGFAYHDGYDWDGYARYYGLPSGYDAYCQYYYLAAAPAAPAVPYSAPFATQPHGQDASVPESASVVTTGYTMPSSAQQPLHDATAPGTEQQGSAAPPTVASVGTPAGSTSHGTASSAAEPCDEVKPTFQADVASTGTGPAEPQDSDAASAATCSMGFPPSGDCQEHADVALTDKLPGGMEAGELARKASHSTEFPSSSPNFPPG